MPSPLEALQQAFPTAVQPEFIVACSRFDLHTRFPPSGGFKVNVDGEQLTIPQRVYFETVALPAKPNFSPIGWATLNLLYTRHHDGFVRERCVQEVITLPHAWVVPYVMHLVGEYVVEILHLVHQHLPALEPMCYANFLAANPVFYAKTQHRVRSYWHCYHRVQYPSWESYVGSQILRYFDALRK